MNLALLLLVLAADWAGSAGGAAELDKQGRVVKLDLRSSWVTDSDMSVVAALPALRHLDLSQTRISDHGLQRLKPARAIASLNLYYAEQITDEGMAAVKGWKNLRELNLRGTKITDTTLEHLGALTTIEKLDAGYAQITDNGIDALGSLSNLKALMLGGNKLTDVGLQALRQIPTLRVLDLGGAQRTDSGLWSISVGEPGIEAVATLKDLEELGLAGTSVAARGIGKLKELPKLSRLDLKGCKRIGDDAVAALAALPALRSLELSGTSVTAPALAALRARLPNATILHSN